MNKITKSKTRPMLVECMMDVAKIFAARSSCSRLSVGAVITNSDMTNINSVGYNGGARGLKNDCDSLEPGQCGHLHAEINALLKADYSVKDKKMFVTHFPCPQCAKAIINAGITELWYGEEYRDSDRSKDIFDSADIKYYDIAEYVSEVDYKNSLKDD